MNDRRGSVTLAPQALQGERQCSGLGWMAALARRSPNGELETKRAYFDRKAQTIQTDEGRPAQFDTRMLDKPLWHNNGNSLLDPRNNKS